jgi:hypothetical protein
MRIAFNSARCACSSPRCACSSERRGVHLGALYSLLVADGFDALAEEAKIDRHRTGSRNSECNPYASARPIANFTRTDDNAGSLARQDGLSMSRVFSQ